MVTSRLVYLGRALDIDMEHIMLRKMQRCPREFHADFDRMLERLIQGCFDRKFPNSRWKRPLEVKANGRIVRAGHFCGRGRLVQTFLGNDIVALGERV